MTHKLIKTLKKVVDKQFCDLCVCKLTPIEIKITDKDQLMKDLLIKMSIIENISK